MTSGSRRFAGLLLLTTALAHGWLAPDHRTHAPVLGLLFVAFAVAGTLLAGLLLTTGQGLAPAGGLCVLAIGAYLLSRTVGLPAHAHDIGDWSDPLANVCLACEAAVVALGLRARRTRRTRSGALVAAALLGLTMAAAPAATAAPPSDHRHETAPTTEHGSHLGAQGLVLAAAADLAAPATGPSRCPARAPRRTYDLVAVGVDLPLNRYGDHDPDGRAYVLAQDLDRLRAQERATISARRTPSAVPVSLGLQDDAIQPLTLRVRPGECLLLTLRNDLPDEPVSLTLRGAALRSSPSGEAAVPGRPDADVSPGATHEYFWAVPDAQPEGTHYFHSAPGDRALGRQQTSHGLYGAVIVEPAGADWLDPATLAPLVTGWAAVITAPGRAPFREFALFYAEVGDETFQPLDRDGAPLPQAESLSGAYRPGARALNYRSEPFYRRLALLQQRTGRVDDSLSYSSYAFGDPATPIMRTYLGDPVTQRVVHAGSETAHVHHVHGGSTRWRRQPGEGPTGATSGLDKHPPLLPGPSERVDSQTLGPSETYDVEDECGAGGCQQSVGDFLFHCHIAHHYFAGMWGLWRVYNTLQDGPRSTDELPPLAALPDRPVRAAVDSSGLGLTPKALDALLRKVLPPPGRPSGYDASVWDWVRSGTTVLGEPEDPTTWPGHRGGPAIRRPVLFDPVTSKPAYPMLRPHLGRRPPFAPAHSPAPYLDPAAGTALPAPGASGPASLCPSGTRRRPLGIRAIEVPLPLNVRRNLWDPEGKLFVLQQHEAAIRADPDLRRPLTLRANAGQDCLDVTLTNALTDARDPHGFSKVSLHVHFVQFDVQGSDGVVGGFNYEQTIRPYAAGSRLGSAAPAGARSLRLPGRYARGALLGVGMERADGPEIVEVAGSSGGLVTLTSPLVRGHAAGEAASPEFVRYRWYPDVQFGTAFFHDHVNAILGQPRGLYGSLVVEPPGSTYTDPRTGKPVDSGAVADITTDQPTSVDVRGSFRELVTYLADDHPLTSLGRDTGGDLNLRVEALPDRPDPSHPFTGSTPETALLTAHVGDPVVLRSLVGASNEVHTLHLDGHTFRVEPWSTRSPPVSTVALGISERFDLSTTAGGPRRQTGDFLLANGRLGKLQSGSWGLLRVAPPGDDAVLPLAGRTAEPPLPVCPAGAPRVEVSLSAVEAPLPMLGGARGLALVATDGGPPTRPLVLHATVGDCLHLRLRNTAPRPVGLTADPLASAAVGSATAPAGGQSDVLLYADPSVGATVALLRDAVDPVATLRQGLYGAIVIHPRGSRWTASPDGVTAVVRAPGQPARREFTVFLHDGDQAIGTHRMPYTRTVDGLAAISYGTPPSAAAGPVLDAFVGDPVTLNVLAPASEQTQVFSVDGHTWPSEPGTRGTTHLSAVTLGGLQAVRLDLDGGAGPLTGEFRYGNARLPYDVAGMTGVLRVHPRGTQVPSLHPLAAGSRSSTTPMAVAVGAGLLGLLGAAALRRRRQRATA